MNRYLVIAIITVISITSLFIGLYIGYNLALRKTSKATDKPPLIIPTGELRIQNISFIRHIDASSNKVAITLFLNIKNIGDKPVVVEKIEVPDANWSIDLNLLLGPGKNYTFSWVILKDLSNDTLWETGETHLVKITYKVSGSSSVYSIGEKAVVK